MEIPYPENSDGVLSDSIFRIQISDRRPYGETVSGFLEQVISFTGI